MDDPDEQPNEQPGPELSEFANPDVEIPQVARRYPSTIGGYLYLVALATTLIGVWIMSTGRWRLGVLWVGGSLLGAAVARLLLPENQAGMLHVRRRLVDVALLVCLGGGLVLVTASLTRR